MLVRGLLREQVSSACHKALADFFHANRSRAFVLSEVAESAS